MRVLVVGIGYVGLTTAMVLAVNNDVDICDIIPEKVNSINAKKFPFKDSDGEQWFASPLKLNARLARDVDYREYELIVIAVSTNFKDVDLDTSGVESIISNLRSTNAVIVIRSTVPIGFSARMKAKYEIEKLLYCPEFLREGTALQDMLHPWRIIIGGDEEYASIYLSLFSNLEDIQRAPTITCGFSEAEAIKLFSNTYLALRVAFFNELDTFSIQNNLDVNICISGVCLDPRIGNYYNNPSFGYAGSCLPKDSKSLMHSFADTPNDVISAVVNANETRKKYIVNEILKMEADVIGVYRINSKCDADNTRESASLDIVGQLLKQGKKVIIYEPLIAVPSILGCEVVQDISEFMRRVDLIVANRADEYISNRGVPIYTRDIFNCN